MPPTVLVGCVATDEDEPPLAFARGVAEALDAEVAPVNVRPSATLVGCEEDDLGMVIGPARLEWASSAASGLQHVIARERPVLTVLGSARAAGHGRVRVGGTAQRVLTGTLSPVAVVPRGYAERPLRTIAVGLLPTPDAVRALRTAATLARAARARLIVVTVLRRSPDPADAAVLAARLASCVSSEGRGPAAALLREAIHAAVRAQDALAGL